MKKVCTIISVLIVAVVIAFSCADSASATTIKEGYVGIVLNLGKAEADVLTPGFYVIPPWKSVVKMDCRWQKY